MTKQVAYRMRRDSKGRLRRVYPFNGVDCYMVSTTCDCSGCTDYGDYGTRYGPFGCEECGHTGKRRQRDHVLFCNHYECAHAVYGGGPAVSCTQASANVVNCSV